jgi:hypothetical protein
MWVVLWKVHAERYQSHMLQDVGCPVQSPRWEISEPHVAGCGLSMVIQSEVLQAASQPGCTWTARRRTFRWSHFDIDSFSVSLFRDFVFVWDSLSKLSNR